MMVMMTMMVMMMMMMVMMMMVLMMMMMMMVHKAAARSGGTPLFRPARYKPAAPQLPATCCLEHSGGRPRPRARSTLPAPHCGESALLPRPSCSGSSCPWRSKEEKRYRVKVVDRHGPPLSESPQERVCIELVASLACLGKSSAADG
jgi:hypothetical protein